MRRRRIKRSPVSCAKLGDEISLLFNEYSNFAASKFLQDSSKMLCGQPMVSDNGDLYKIISRIEDNSKEFDKAELDSLPST